MKQLDLTEGDVTTESHVTSDFTISFTNSSFSQTNGTITVTPPGRPAHHRRVHDGHLEGCAAVLHHRPDLPYLPCGLGRPGEQLHDQLQQPGRQLAQPDRRRLRKRRDLADAHPGRLHLWRVVHHCRMHRHRLHCNDDAGDQSDAVCEVDGQCDHAVHRQALSAGAGRYFLRAVRHPEPHRHHGRPRSRRPGTPMPASPLRRPRR